MIGGLKALLQRRVELRARPWVERALPAPGLAFDVGRFREAFESAPRRLGRHALELDAREHAGLPALGVDWPLRGWQLADLGRVVALLVAAGRLSEDSFAVLIEECFRRGDTGERRAVLRALPFLPRGGRFVGLAVGACRTTVQPLFEAIACDNPYPARHFDEDAFNDLALKMLLTGAPLGRLIGLGGRLTARLRRLGAELSRQYAASAKPVPGDLALLR